jgi:hypothetical protein
MMFLVTWESEYESTSNVMKRSRPAADEVFNAWIVEARGDASDVVTMYVVDDVEPDITLHEVKYWAGVNDKVTLHPRPEQYAPNSPVGHQFIDPTPISA